ncbi:MAG: HEAT repeat domain-containing protein [Kofleriaceae bacterium]|nr:HEAT repeat domain-containing protein [Kofleriaceae bacterium]
MSAARSVALGTLLAVLLVVPAARQARADQLDVQIRQVRTGDTYKLRLAAALALSRSRDPRALAALADTVERGSDASVRRLAALALGKQIDPTTPAATQARARAALAKAARSDRDRKVRTSAAQALAAVESVPPPVTRDAARVASGSPSLPAGSAAGPPVFVNVDPAVDLSRRASAATAGLTRRVKGAVKLKGYAVDWPAGGLPTSGALVAANSQGFIVGTSVKKVDVRKRAGRTEVACTVAIRVAPWSGRDGGERWEAHQAASASGSATAVTGASDREIAGGIRDCLEAVAEEITTRQVLPFLRRVASAQ